MPMRIAGLSFSRISTISLVSGFISSILSFISTYLCRNLSTKLTFKFRTSKFLSLASLLLHTSSIYITLYNTSLSVPFSWQSMENQLICNRDFEPHKRKNRNDTRVPFLSFQMYFAKSLHSATGHTVKPYELLDCAMVPNDCPPVNVLGVTLKFLVSQ